MITNNYFDIILEKIKKEQKQIDFVMFVVGYSQNPQKSNTAQIIYALQDAIARGVKVRAISDIGAGVEFLLESGIEAKKSNPRRRIHAKMFIFSDSVIVGSHNLTDRGLKNNFEVSAELTDFENLNEANQIFENLWAEL